MIKILILFMTIFFMSCAPSIIPPNPYTRLDNCTQACSNLFVLNCPGWYGNPGLDKEWNTEDDKSCEDLCKGFSKDNQDFDPSCVAHIESCFETTKCYVLRGKK